MPRSPRALPPRRWNIQSAYVRHRDGAQRLERAYLILVADSTDGNDPQPDERSNDDACRDLRPGVHGTPGPRADD
jgi:hypothetical protein